MSKTGDDGFDGNIRDTFSLADSQGAGIIISGKSSSSHFHPTFIRHSFPMFYFLCHVHSIVENRSKVLEKRIIEIHCHKKFKRIIPPLNPFEAFLLTHDPTPLLKVPWITLRTKPRIRSILEKNVLLLYN